MNLIESLRILGSIKNPAANGPPVLQSGAALTDSGAHTGERMSTCTQVKCYYGKEVALSVAACFHLR